MLLTEHEKYHKMSPKDVGLQGATAIQISRATNQTGEHFTCECPIYPDDSREMLRDRLNFFLSILQDRMEDENKAVAELNEKQAKVRHAKVLIEKNNKTFVAKAKALAKRFKRKAITQAEYEAELKQLQDELKAANDPIQKDLESEGEEFNPPLPEDASEEVVEDENVGAPV